MSDTQLLTAQENVSVAEQRHSRAMQRSAEKQSLPGLGTTTPGELTPSDLVVLRRRHWSKEELNGVVRVQIENLPHEVIKAALASAVLANEEAGALRLEMSQEKFFFGLFASTTLRVVRTGNDAQWPTGSLESRLGGIGSVSDIIHRWLGADSREPWVSAGQRIMKRMTDIRVLDREVVRKKVLKFFTVTSKHYVQPERTLAMFTRRPVRRLLEKCEQTRPEVHDRLMGEIDNGIGRRQIAPEDSGY